MAKISRKFRETIVREREKEKREREKEERERERKRTERTRDLAPKANVVRCHHRHTPQWRGWALSMGGWHFHRGWCFSWGVALS